MALVVKNLPDDSGDIRYTGLIPGSGRSLGEGNNNPLRYSFFFFFHSGILAQKFHRQRSLVFLHGVAKSWTRVSD